MAEALNEAGLKMAIEAFNDLLTSCNQIERRAEAKMSEAESELTTIRKVRGFVRIALDESRKNLTQMQEAQKK